MYKNLQIAIKAPLAMGKVIMDVYDTAFSVEFKGDNSSLSEANMKANAVINSYLFPTDIPIISEENTQTGYTIRKSKETSCIEDPFDGTKEFIKCNDEFTFKVALVTNGKSVLGLIYVPVNWTIYFGNVDMNQAFKADLESHDVTVDQVLEISKPIQPKNDKTNLVQFVGSRSHMNQDTLDYVESLKAGGNLGYIENLLNQIQEQREQPQKLGMFVDLENKYPFRFPLSDRDQKLYWVIQHLYEQQVYMYENKIHSVKDRIVNIYQPYVRPIPRGKDKAATEFGAKISASVVEGMSRVEHINWNQFNESTDLILQVEAYKTVHNRYPELVLADQIYLNRKNRKWLKEKGIRSVGKPLGRPPKVELSAYQKRKLKKERNERNHIEAKFGQGKNAYGLASIKAKRSDTSQSWIGAIFFVMNLITLTKIADKYAIFCAFFKMRLIQWDKLFRKTNYNIYLIKNSQPKHTNQQYQYVY